MLQFFSLTIFTRLRASGKKKYISVILLVLMTRMKQAFVVDFTIVPNYFFLYKKRLYFPAPDSRLGLVTCLGWWDVTERDSATSKHCMIPPALVF